MSKERTVFDVDIKVRARKWFDIVPKDQVVIDRDDFEWLKDEAAKLVGVRNDLERIRDENLKLQKQMMLSNDNKEDARKELGRQKNRNKLLMEIIKDHDLYDVFLAKVEAIKAESSKRTDDMLKAAMIREGVDLSDID